MATLINSIVETISIPVKNDGSIKLPESNAEDHRKYMAAFAMIRDGMSESSFVLSDGRKVTISRGMH